MSSYFTSAYNWAWGIEEMTEEQKEAAFQEFRAQFPEMTEPDLRKVWVARKGDATAAIEQVKATAKWRAETFPIDPKLTQPYIDLAYWSQVGEDNEGRPVIYWIGSRYGDVANRNTEATVLHLAQLVEETLARYSGKENSDGMFTVILYVNKGSVFCPDLIKKAATTLSAHYPERLNKAIIFPGTRLAYTLWGIAKWFFDPKTREKIVLCSMHEEIQQHVPKTSLISMFGGEAELPPHVDWLTSTGPHEHDAAGDAIPTEGEAAACEAATAAAMEQAAKDAEKLQIQEEKAAAAAAAAATAQK
jgi:hypothetical protein